MSYNSYSFNTQIIFKKRTLVSKQFTVYLHFRMILNRRNEIKQTRDI